MPEFIPGEQKEAIVPMTNPTAKAFDYVVQLYMGVELAIMSEASFHLEAGESKDISMPVTMPTEGGVYPVNIGVFSDGQFIEPVYHAEDVTIKPAVISFTLTLIHCPLYQPYSDARWFKDGTGTLIPCGSPGSWTVETVPFNFSIEIHMFWPRGGAPYYGWHYVTTYSFSATVENGKDYIYDCATGEFGEITEVRMVRAYWKMATGSISSFLLENGVTFNGKRAIDPDTYTGLGTQWALCSTFIIPIAARITQIEFKLLGVYGYYVRFDYKWTDQKPGEAEVIIAQGSKSPPYEPDPYKAFTHYTIPV